MKNLDVIIGIAIASVIYLGYLGVDIVPFIFLAGLAGTIFYLNGGQRIKGIASAGAEEKVASPVSFEDIGGQDIAKNELCEALDFINNSERIKTLGIRPIKGILLNGPPGTGKTLLAKAAAQYTDSIFIAASGSEFVEMYVGVGAKRVRQLFAQAREKAQKAGKTNAIIFIDEMEVLGGSRGQNHGHQEHDQTLNELLVQMDGLGSGGNVKILVIAATNRVDMLDPALLRPGRFDRLVKVDLPDKKGRLQILKLHTRNKPLDADVSLDTIASDTFGFSGAHLESVANEAAIMAMREEMSRITAGHFRNAIEKVMMGEKLDRLPNPEEKHRVIVHEAGHALVSELTNPYSVASVNVASRSNALGYVRQTQEDDKYLYTLDFLRSKIAVALAGALSEELILGNRSTGSSNDFKQAADLARQIVYCGMSDLGVILPDEMPKDKLHDAATDIIKAVEQETKEMLSQSKELLEKVVNILSEKETISGEDLRNILAA